MKLGSQVLALVLGTSLAAGQETSTSVLFLGNSYTAGNNVPGLFASLAQAGGHAVVIDAHTPGGNTLGYPQPNGLQHASNPTSLGKIAAQAWDVLVLQEQSFLPTVAAAQEGSMKPGAIALEAALAASSPTGRTLMYSTWGRENGGQLCGFGGCSPVFADMQAMTDHLSVAYWDVALEIGGEVAPVGQAFVAALALDPTLDLYAADGSHASLQGSYLAACTFYASVFGESPVGLGFGAGLPAGIVATLQAAAEGVTPAIPPSCTPASGYGPGALGSGVAGSNQIGLGLSGEAELGGVLTLNSSALPLVANPLWVAIGAGSAQLPFASGTLLVDPALLVMPLVPGFHFPLTGSAAHQLVLPVSPQLLGLVLYAQSFMIGVQGELLLSNGLQFGLCP